jgi:hypothetical protein
MALYTRIRRERRSGDMPFTVLSYTREQVASGAALLPIRLSEKLTARLWEIIQTGKQVFETCEVEMYFLNNIQNAASFERLKANFGGDPMDFMFLNECAVRALEHFEIPISPVGTIEELPGGVGILLTHRLAII